MRIAFAGLRHSHIFQLAKLARKHAEVEIAGFWDEDSEASLEGEKFFSERKYPSYQELLNDPEVDAVAVGDYYSIRGKRIIEALKAGKHVLTDKPVCTKLDELEEIASLCQTNGLKLGCMLDLRYDPALRHASNLIRSEALGKIHALSFTGQHALSWRIRPKWYFEEGKHGGTLNDLAIHGLDAVEMITGIPYAKTLLARQWNAFAVQAPSFCDCAQFIGELENGAGLIADVSYSAPTLSVFSLPSYWRFAFWGDQGWLECRLGEGAVSVALAGDDSPVKQVAASVTEDYLTDFIDEVHGKPTHFDTQSILRSSRIALELQRNADERKDGLL